ncbi:MAG: NUDIX domain-containing protein [bacterium]|nr:NUDIX domain-containing protein [bacterium]
MDSQVAVKAVILNKQGKFLIVREGSRWQAVGGRLEKGDSLEKEIKEAIILASMSSNPSNLS